MTVPNMTKPENTAHRMSGCPEVDAWGNPVKYPDGERRPNDVSKDPRCPKCCPVSDAELVTEFRWPYLDRNKEDASTDDLLAHFKHAPHLDWTWADGAYLSDMDG